MSTVHTSTVVGLLNHVWLLSISDEALRKYVGLRYVSHNWNECPGWHFWLMDCRGVFRMELKELCSAAGYDWAARFTIKYYPDRTEDAFLGLSALEKRCRESEVFDTPPSDGLGGCGCHSIAGRLGESHFADLASGCGVPRADYIGAIPEDFFLAGHLILAYRDGKGSLFRADTLSRWIVTMSSSYTLMDTEGKTVVSLRRGQTDRDFPGYKLTDAFSRRFIKAWGLHHQYKGLRETMYRHPGMVFKTDGKAIAAELSDEVERISILTELTCGKDDVLPFI